MHACARVYIYAAINDRAPGSFTVARHIVPGLHVGPFYSSSSIDHHHHLLRAVISSLGPISKPLAFDILTIGINVKFPSIRFNSGDDETMHACMHAPIYTYVISACMESTPCMCICTIYRRYIDKLYIGFEFHL